MTMKPKTKRNRRRQEAFDKLREPNNHDRWWETAYYASRVAPTAAQHKFLKKIREYEQRL